MSSKDFLNEMLSVGEEHSAKPVSTITALMTIQFGYSGYAKGHRMDKLFQPFNDPKDGKRVAAVAAEVSSTLAESGGKGGAIFGILVSIPAGTILSFESQWDNNRFIDRFSDEKDFFAISEAVGELGLPIGKPFWCKYENIESPSAVEKGDAGKYEKKKDGVGTGQFVFPKIALPIEIFASEAAARAESGNNTSATSSRWSATVIANYPEPDEVDNLANQIYEAIEKAKKGIPYNDDAVQFPLPVPPNPPAIKQYVAKIFMIESSDIDQLTPF